MLLNRALASARMTTPDEADTALLLTLGKVTRNGAVLEFIAQTLLRELLDLPDAVGNALLPDDMSGTLLQLRRIGQTIDIDEQQAAAVNAWAQEVAAAWTRRSVVVHSQWAVSSCSDDLVRIQRRRGRPHEAEPWTLHELEEVALGLAGAAHAAGEVWQTLGWDMAGVEDALPES